MLFNSLEFLIFIILFFVAWPLMRKANNRRWIYLTVASFFFYGWWDWRFLLLILGSGLIDFFAGLAMHSKPKFKKLFLILSIIGNIGSLAIFKYLDFIIGNLNWLSETSGIGSPIATTNLILPVGISFYTFQSMSYTIDIYRGKLEPTHNVFHFFAYLSMFPQLVAGPIVRASDLLPQLKNVMLTDETKRWRGMQLIALGFFKKVVVADTLAPLVNAAFAGSTPINSSAYWWIIMVLFSFQIYCDFSGYSDIARGLAKWMGYDFPLNFNHPYISKSIREFWTRWHISLSTWFRDYVYIPLGGSHRGMVVGMFNMWITMMVSGLWHGAAWTFLFWGFLHGLYLFAERITKWPQRLGSLPGGAHISAILIFIMVLVSWVFFRAQSFSQAQMILLQLINISNFNLGLAKALISGKAILLTLIMITRQLYVYFGLDNHQWNDSKLVIAIQPVVVGLLLVGCIFLRGPGSAFIYFQF